MARFFKEPLLHFLVLGALIFYVYSQVADSGQAEDEIYISRGQQENLINTFTRTWQRPPTAQEFQGLLADLVRQEIAYRESRNLGLDQDDIVIRRRLRQKMEMVAEDVVSLLPPTDDELSAYLSENADQYQVESTFSLHQVYFSVDRRGDEAESDASLVLQALEGAGPEQGEQLETDPIPLPAELKNARRGEVSNIFGDGFAESLEDLPTGQWSGPVASGFGWHLVYLVERQDGMAATLEQVREAVKRDLMAQRRREAVDLMYQELLKSYQVEIEPLVESDPAPAS